MEDPALHGWPLQFTRYRCAQIACPHRHAQAVVLAASWATAYTNWTDWSVVDCSLQPAGLIACQMDCLRESGLNVEVQ